MTGGLFTFDLERQIEPRQQLAQAQDLIKCQ